MNRMLARVVAGLTSLVVAAAVAPAVAQADLPIYQSDVGAPTSPNDCFQIERDAALTCPQLHAPGGIEDWGVDYMAAGYAWDHHVTFVGNGGWPDDPAEYIGTTRQISLGNHVWDTTVIIYRPTWQLYWAYRVTYYNAPFCTPGVVCGNPNPPATQVVLERVSPYGI